MTFMHKLSCRLALLKDAICIVAALAAASCNIGPRTAPTDGSLARLSISPTLDSLHLNQSTDLTVQGTNQAGDMAPLSLSFSVRGTTGGQITGVTNPSRGRAVGHFKAGQTPGRDSVIAVDTSGIADTAVIIVTPPPVAFVTVAPATATVSVGNTTAFSATPFDSAGTILANRTVTWSSAAPAVATVNAAGLASGVASGSARIIATSESKTDTAVLTVVNVPVASVTVTPLTAAVFVGATTPFSVTLRDAAGQVLTGRVVTWQSSSIAIATVNASGVARGVAAGTASIIATSEGQGDTASVTVSVVPVASVTVTPASATVGVGATTPFSVTLRDAAGQVLTGRVVTWQSSSTAIATVDASGVATGVAAGTASIIATSEGVSDTASVTVSVPVASVTVTPPTAAVFVGATTPFSVTLRDAAGQVLTGRVVTWQSTSTAIATVNASGVARGVALGTASIIATSEGQSDTSTVTVSLVPVASVTVTPASATVVVGATTPLSVTLRDSAGGVLTGRIIVWASLNTAVATVTTQGVVRGVAAGSTGVNATSEGDRKSTRLNSSH